MSTEATPAAVTHEAAQQYLSEQVYAPQFFSKLASLGLTPQNSAECAQLLSLVVSLRGRDYQPTKTAAAQAANGNPFLDSLLQKEAAIQAKNPNYLKQASVQALQHDQQLLAAMQVLLAPATAS